MKTLSQLKCLRCGNKWFPRSAKKPRFCAGCNSPYWDKKRVMHRPVTKIVVDSKQQRA